MKQPRNILIFVAFLSVTLMNCGGHREEKTSFPYWINNNKTPEINILQHQLLINFNFSPTERWRMCGGDCRGCYIPETNTIYCPWDNHEVCWHEVLHALGFEHDSEPDSWIFENKKKFELKDELLKQIQ